MRSVSRSCSVLALLLCSSLALATGKPKPPPKPEPPKTPVVNVVSSPAAKSEAEANSDANAESKADAKSDSNASLISNSEYRERLQAPSINAPPVYASGPCSLGWSAGLSVPGGGISGGKAKSDPSCDRRELIRVITPLNPYLALKLACEDPLIVEMRLRNLASVSDCTFVPPPPPNPPSPPGFDRKPSPKVTEIPVTRGEVREMVEKAFKQTTGK